MLTRHHQKVDQMVNEHNVSALRNKLIRLAKRGKPVFLYGVGCIDEEEAVEEIGKSIFKKHEHISCRKMNGEDVYNKLANGKVSALFKYTGSLFVDMLYCDPNDNNDLKYYNKLAKIIKNGSIEMEENEFPPEYDFDDISKNPDAYASFCHRVTVKWLVVYSKEPNNIPSYFKRQFKMFSLEKYLEETVVIDEARNLLTFKGGEVKIADPQIKLLALLDRHKDKFVSKLMINDELWKGSGAYEQQIYDHISKIVTAFVGLGFDKETIKTKMIKTVKKRNPSVGGYISIVISFL